jgi:hypothetical protein
MFKRTVVALCALVIFSASEAQSFMHGVGTGTLLSTAKNSNFNAFGTLLYNPRFSFAETESSSFSIGVPLTLGLSGSYSYDSYSGVQNSSRFMVNAPLIFDFNMGAGSSKETEDRFGWFAGAGFGLNLGSFYTPEVYDSETGGYTGGQSTHTSFGPAVNGGVRFAVGQRTHNIEVLLSYMKGINDLKPNTFGIQAMFNF